MELEEINMWNLGTIGWRKYLAANMKESLFDWNIDQTRARSDLPRTNNLTKRMYLASPDERPTGEVTQSDSRTVIKIAYRLCVVAPPDFDRHLRETVKGVIRAIEAGKAASPVPDCLARQYAHDLLYGLADAASCPSRPFPPMESLLIYHLFRFFCDEGDNVYAAATSPRVLELRDIFLDPEKTQIVKNHLSRRATFRPAGKNTTWEHPSNALLFPPIFSARETRVANIREQRAKK